MPKLQPNFSGEHSPLLKVSGDAGVEVRKGKPVTGTPCAGSQATDPGSPLEAWGLSAKIEVEESTTERNVPERLVKSTRPSLEPE